MRRNNAPLSRPPSPSLATSSLSYSDSDSRSDVASTDSETLFMDLRTDPQHQQRLLTIELRRQTAENLRELARLQQEARELLYGPGGLLQRTRHRPPTGHFQTQESHQPSAARPARLDWSLAQEQHLRDYKTILDRQQRRAPTRADASEIDTTPKKPQRPRWH